MTTPTTDRKTPSSTAVSRLAQVGALIVPACLFFFCISVVLSTDNNRQEALVELLEVTARDRLVREVIDASDFIQVVCNEDCEVIDTSKGFGALTGYAPAELYNQSLYHMIPDHLLVYDSETGCKTLPGWHSQNPPGRLLRIFPRDNGEIIRKDGTRVPVTLVASRVRTYSPSKERYVVRHLLFIVAEQDALHWGDPGVPDLFTMTGE